MREKKTKNPQKNYKNTKSKNIVKTPVGEIYILLYAQRRTVPCIFFMRLSVREKKTKNPKKLQNTKYKKKNIVKILLRICIRKFLFKMPRGDSIQCISLYFLFRGEHIQCLAANNSQFFLCLSAIVYCALWPIVLKIFLKLSMREKLKIPKKITKI